MRSGSKTYKTTMNEKRATSSADAMLAEGEIAARACPKEMQYSGNAMQ